MLVFHCFMQGELGALISGYLCIAVANGSMLTSGVQHICDGMSLLGFCCICNVDQLALPNLTKEVGAISDFPLADLDKSKRKTLEVVTYI
jgi:POT family proton-dependent oligopeptide transporter